MARTKKNPQRTDSSPITRGVPSLPSSRRNAPIKKLNARSAPGAERTLNRKNALRTSNLLNMTLDDLEPSTTSTKPPAPKSASNRIRKAELEKFRNLFTKVDAIRRSRCNGLFKPLLRRVTNSAGKKKTCLFQELIDHECDFRTFVNALQNQSQWLPSFVTDNVLMKIESAALLVGWSVVLESDELVLVKQNYASMNCGAAQSLKSFPMKKLTGALAPFNAWRFHITSSQTGRGCVFLMLQRCGGLLLSNFKALTERDDYARPYDELGPDKLVQLTGYKPSFFENVGKASIGLTLFEDKSMKKLIDELPEGKFGNKQQRALKANAVDLLVDKLALFKKSKIYPIISKHLFPSIMKVIEENHSTKFDI